MKKPNRIQCFLVVACFATASLLSAGCALYAMCFEWEVVSESRQYPKKPDFSIAPQPVQKGALVDFSAVYYNCIPAMQYADRVLGESYNFIRFWPSGHVYIRVSDHMPEDAEVDDFHSAYMGFYELDGTNLIMELFVRRWGYIKSSGYINNEGIYFYEVERRDGKTRERHPKQDRYIKHHIDGLSRLPDWSPTGMLQRATWAHEEHEADRKSNTP